MPGIHEKDNSEDIKIAEDKREATRVWEIYDCADDATAETLVKAIAPTTWRDQYRGPITIKSRGTRLWDAAVEYVPRKPLEPGDFDFRFDIGTESTHITHAIANRNRYPGGAPDLKGAIGWDGKELKGTDILVPKSTLNWKVILAEADVDDTYKANLRKLVGKINDDTFKGCAAGELLLIAATGSYRNESIDYEINFSAAYSENATGLTVGGVTGITKRGWDYLWVKWKPILDAGIKKIDAEAVYVDQVYKEGDFDLLLIP